MPEKPNAEILRENREALLGDVRKWVTDIACQDLNSNPAVLVPSLLALNALLLGKLHQAQQGGNFYRITPFRLGAEGQKIIEKQNDGLLRTVIVVVDNASGGPTPTIRISENKGGTLSGGIRINAGQGTNIGEVPADKELWGGSDTAISAYVIEFG